MEKSYNQLLALVLMLLSYQFVYSQCVVTIPQTTIQIDTSSEILAGLSDIWLCTQDTIISDSGSNTFYMESGTYLTGGGGGFTIYLKNCARFNSSGGGGHTIYHEPNAEILDAGTGAIIIPCPRIDFDYSLVDISLCDTTRCIISALNTIDQLPLSARIIPNPLVDDSYVELSRPLSLNDRLIVYNVNGEIIYIEEELRGTRIRLDKSLFTSGVYLYEIQEVNKVLVSGKFLVN